MLNSSHIHFSWDFWRLQNLSSIMTSPRKPTCVQLRDPFGRRWLNAHTPLGLALTLSLPRLGPSASSLAPWGLSFLVWKIRVIILPSSQG